MIILSDSTTIINPLLGVFLVVVIATIVVYLLTFDAFLSLDKLKTWFVFTILGVILTVLIYFIVETAQKQYKIYLQDMTLEELETEYDINEIDGLILHCTKKEK
jgi:amino acid permease